MRGLGSATTEYSRRLKPNRPTVKTGPPDYHTTLCLPWNSQTAVGGVGAAGAVLNPYSSLTYAGSLYLYPHIVRQTLSVASQLISSARASTFFFSRLDERPSRRDRARLPHCIFSPLGIFSWRAKMISNRIIVASRHVKRASVFAPNSSKRRGRGLATIAPVTPVASASRNHKVVVIGGGSAGLSISHQLLRTGPFSPDDIAIVDPAEWHHYQPGWTLVGGGLKSKQELRRPLRSLIDPKLKFYQQTVSTFAPGDNSIQLGNGDTLTYEHLVVAPGIKIDYGSIKGLPEALADPNSLVSSVYGYDTCDKVFGTFEKLQRGNAIFTQPAGAIKCAGAPQKVMWLALDYWKRAGLYNGSNNANAAASPINITFATGTPAMFGVPKYSAKLDELRKERGVEGLFQHDLVAVEGNTATFARPDGKESVTRQFDLLHVVPKMGPHAFVKDSLLADAAGFVDVDQATTRHTKYANVWSSGDASSLPTSKTAAAITSQAPILVSNLLRSLAGKEPEPKYDGYTSCPLTTEYGKVLLAEFKYGGVPKETFGDLIGFDQAVPRRAFYHLKKDFFPWVYYNSMVKGTWSGPTGWLNES
ncbi:Sulfide:quinone oxidoreductase, mitochondrial [Colletotrichum tanaceti]|uniref:Sulfide:quinone oxidoreductase, mitochondrial n=1 Tax=Colletotrichum tanaceti TaxID=1306861 RepID=A0A4U6X3A9_9PEZI|nr:Sulfide:quinone oxidoreductase, mitochondrial [Colletotrichum tanaceti]TKW49393.1 Sulfide:quinone oxidoreductase, mitochondrial [Colletotrichum tanaceti]